RPVEFVREVEAMYQAGARLFVEVGPRNVLTGLVGRILGEGNHVCVPLDVPGGSGLAQLNHALAALVAEGVPVDPEPSFLGGRVRVEGCWGGGGLDDATSRRSRPNRAPPGTGPPPGWSMVEGLGPPRAATGPGICQPSRSRSQ